MSKALLREVPKRLRDGVRACDFAMRMRHEVEGEETLCIAGSGVLGVLD